MRISVLFLAVTLFAGTGATQPLDVHDDANGYVAGGEELEALAKRDWTHAEPLLRQLAAGPGKRTAALAHALLYRHEPNETERAVLLRIAEDTSAPGRARDTAFEALMRTEWEGRDAWYLARFADPTLFRLIDGNYFFAPLVEGVDADPNYWIPKLAELTKSPDKTIRTNAANILASFQLDTARADALRPLLPWLTDREWASAASLERLRIVQSVAQVKLTEAIPGLQWICRNDSQENMRDYAAKALIELGAPDAMACAREALAKSTDAMTRRELEQQIARAGIMEDQEIVEALVAYASAVSTAQKRADFQMAQLGARGIATAQATLGAQLWRNLPQRDSLAQLLIARMSRPGPETAILARIVSSMNLPVAHRWLATRLAHADSFVIASLMEHREEVAKNAANELRWASADNPVARGIAAVLINDDAAIHELLANGPVESRKAFFSAARIARRSVDPAEVLRASKDAQREAAALLERMNTAESRLALTMLYPGAIFGELPAEDPGHTTFGFFDGWEARLRSLQLKGDYDRLYALAMASYWGGSREIVVLAEKKNTMTLRAPRRERLSSDAAALLKGVHAEIRPDDLPPFFNEGSHDGAQYEYVSLTRLGGHRLFMNNPSSREGDPYGRLVAEMTALATR